MARLIVADWDDMVFEDRNQSFGAYALRKSYPRHLLIATLSISLLLLLSTWGPLHAKRMGWIGTERERTTSIVIPEMVDPPVLNPEKPAVTPPTPPQNLHQPVETVEFLVPEPTPEDQADLASSMASVEKLAEAPNFGPEDQDGKPLTSLFPVTNGDPEVPAAIVNPDPAPTAFRSVEQEPVPVNIKDITDLIGYPQIARDAEVEGVVVARILVDQFGNYDRHIIIREAHPLIQNEVEKHLAKLRFTPAIQGGRPIKFWVNVPFRFELLR